MEANYSLPIIGVQRKTIVPEFPMHLVWYFLVSMVEGQEEIQKEIRLACAPLDNSKQKPFPQIREGLFNPSSNLLSLAFDLVATIQSYWSLNLNHKEIGV